MATYNYFTPDEADPNKVDLKNFGIVTPKTLTTSNTSSDSFKFKPYKSFLVIIDASVGFAGSLNLQIKVGSGNWFNAYTFTSTTKVQSVFSPADNTLWRFTTASDFVGSVTVQAIQARTA